MINTASQVFKAYIFTFTINVNYAENHVSSNIFTKHAKTIIHVPILNGDF